MLLVHYCFNVFITGNPCFNNWSLLFKATNHTFEHEWKLHWSVLWLTWEQDAPVKPLGMRCLGGAPRHWMETELLPWLITCLRTGMEGMYSSSFWIFQCILLDNLWELQLGTFLSSCYCSCPESVSNNREEVRPCVWSFVDAAVLPFSLPTCNFYIKPLEVVQGVI